MADSPKFQVVEGAELEALEEDCQDVIRFAAEKFGVELSFDDQSIHWVSSFIEDHQEGMDSETQRTYAVKFGIFLGCAIIHHFGGTWVLTEDDNLAVRFASGAMAFPVTKTAKQMRNGLVDNIYGLYRHIETLLSRGQTNP